jgi:predicted glycosyltransferase
MIYSDEDWGTVYDAIPFQMKKMGLVTSDLLPATNSLSKTILVLAGGGTRLMSEALIEPVVQATEIYRKQGYKVRFIVGPLGDFEKNKSLAKNAHNFELVASCAVEEAAADAKVVIARCGYSTAAVLVRTSLPIIFIPYGRENAEEQFDRARKLTTMKNIWMVDADNDGDYLKLTALLHTAMASEQKPRSTDMSFNGAEAAANYIAQIAGKMPQKN